MLAAHRDKLRQTLVWFGVTFVLGLAFLGLELHEFSDLVYAGHSWTSNAFMSSFFTLVGTHGLHITVGLLWMSVMMTKLVTTGLTRSNLRRLSMLSLFWHFLDVIWIFIFTIVYLFGGLGI